MFSSAAGPVYHWTVNSMLDMWANEYTAWDFANPDAGTLSHFTMVGSQPAFPERAR